jgi:hypothetical protein
MGSGARNWQTMPLIGHLPLLRSLGLPVDSNSGGEPYPFLCASAKGYNPKQNKANLRWNHRVLKTHWEYLKELTLPSEYDTYGYSPHKGAKGTPPENMNHSGTNFRNCGETYPFMYILRYAIPSRGVEKTG